MALEHPGAVVPGYQAQPFSCLREEQRGRRRGNPASTL